MDNFFISEYFDWKQPGVSKRVEVVNRLLAKLGFWCRLRPPDVTGSMTNIERRMNMFHLVSQVLAYGVPGDLVEVGCNAGRSCVLIQKVIEHYDRSRKLHAYDSFAGLPKIHDKDGSTTFHPGQMRVTRQTVEDNFRTFGLRPPEIHVGWFSETLPTQLPEWIAFAHLDGDLYESIKVSLQYVYPRLAKGAVCLVDDYCDRPDHIGFTKLPGVKRACDEFFVDKAERVFHLYAGKDCHGYFRKL